MAIRAPNTTNGTWPSEIRRGTVPRRVSGGRGVSSHVGGLSPCSSSVSCVKAALLAWYAANGRDLPWRHTNDPYAILVSEVMLQQTQVDRVVPRWERWLERWPTVDDLAAASTADVIVEWQGLGYNRRAVTLHRAAQAVAREGWPDDLEVLPGVGPYTAAAVGNFAFGRNVLPVDIVSWNSEAGRVRGTIVKVHTKDVNYKGYVHHASCGDPQYEIKSDKTDHVAMHKGAALRRLD